MKKMRLKSFTQKRMNKRQMGKEKKKSKVYIKEHFSKGFITICSLALLMLLSLIFNEFTFASIYPQ